MNPTVETIIRDYQRQLAAAQAENETLRKRLFAADRRDEWTQGLLRQLNRKVAANVA
ncbi:hypothetical protein NCCP2495_05720 [Dietzia sp. NCCP-2495]|uniref:hypothetical protein n=1 Tax=Dietzia sp. NCCP-2495 TaxID=2934675 RepID=UPI00222FE4F8|nr:hypothetical protein [Dietzia sp. NCCP-2495]GLB62694.1 hypothetical protein NCCP2495_05720 [Dietzia sp. NCCP-2495]